MKKTHMIGNAHLDPVWQWRVPEGMALVKSTYRAALDRMKEYPDYVFTSACAAYYKWIELSEPEMFAEILERHKEGRWTITGGMWVQPDCNIPSGEALSRHFLYSQKYFKEKFGELVKTGYNVDTFGHNGMMPQILKKSGIDSYVYHRPNHFEEKPNLPKQYLHYWSSPDGSEVMAYRIPWGYGGDIEEYKIDWLKESTQPEMLFYGVGNHGGGPTVRQLNQTEALREEYGKDTMVYSGVDDYFRYIRENESDIPIPHVDEDLQHHASGCYSANGTVKEKNRRAECELVYAEKIDLMSTLLTGSQPKSKSIEKAWEIVMFNQFHDILDGCSIKPAYIDAYNGFGSASETAMQVGTFGAERISWRVNTTKFLEYRPSDKRDRLWLREGEGSPMVVFNPHSFPVKAKAVFGIGWVSGVVDSNDNEVPFQLIRAPYTDGEHFLQCMFEVELEPYGYATYFIFKEDQNYQPKPVENEFAVTANSIENSKVKITVNPHTGAIDSYVDKETGEQLNAAPMAAAIIEDDHHTDTWAHKVFDFNRDIGAFSDAKIEIVETGYLRATLKVTTTYNRSTLVQYFSLYRGSKNIEVRCKLNFGEHYKIAKLSFPMNVEDPEAVYSMPFGFIKKEANGLEEPAQGWISVADREKKNGFALLNNCKYSFCVKGNEMRMVMARGSAFLDHYGQNFRDGEMDFLDQGEQEFEYVIMPHADDNYAEILKAGELLNTPVRLYHETHHRGTLPPVYSGLSVSADNVIVQAMKYSEDGKSVILRSFEASGKAVDAEIDLKILGTKCRFHWGPQEIKTIAIDRETLTAREVLIIEE